MIYNIYNVYGCIEPNMSYFYLVFIAILFY